MLCQEFKFIWRNSSTIGKALIFFIMSVSSFAFFLQENSQFLNQVGPVLLWYMAFFSLLLSCPALIEEEMKEGTIEQTILATQWPGYWICQKVIAYFFTFGIAIFISCFFLCQLFLMRSDEMGMMILTMVIGFPALTLCALFSSMLAFGLNHQGLLSVVLMLPLCLPLITSAIVTIEGLSRLQSGAENFIFFIGIVFIMIPLFFSASLYALNQYVEDSHA